MTLSMLFPHASFSQRRPNELPARNHCSYRMCVVFGRSMPAPVTQEEQTTLFGRIPQSLNVRTHFFCAHSIIKKSRSAWVRFRKPFQTAFTYTHVTRARVTAGPHLYDSYIASSHLGSLFGSILGPQKIVNCVKRKICVRSVSKGKQMVCVCIFVLIDWMGYRSVFTHILYLHITYHQQAGIPCAGPPDDKARRWLRHSQQCVYRKKITKERDICLSNAALPQ